MSDTSLSEVIRKLNYINANKNDFALKNLRTNLYEVIDSLQKIMDGLTI